jgi:RNA polymerase sigma factor (sigma-70 family)
LSGVYSVVNENEVNTNGTPDSELLGRLFDGYAAALELYARQLCDTAEDVVQEALIGLARQRHTPDDPAAWLYRVVRNKAISATRSARRRKRHESIVAERRAEWFEPSAADPIDAQAATAELASLALEQREIVVARIWGELSFQQIGQLVGVSDSAAHRRYEAALSTLRQKLRLPCAKNE